jgi:hypothetical protein
MSVIIDGTSGITSPTLDLTSGQLSVADGGTGTATGENLWRNKIINGAMLVSQRGTTFADVGNATSTPTYTLDRWFGWRGSFRAGATIGQQTGFNGYQNSIRIQRNVSTTTVDDLYVGQIIETNNCYDLAGQTITISFYARAGANYSGGVLSIGVSTGSNANGSSASLAIGTWTSFLLTTTTKTISTTGTLYTATVTIPSGTQSIGLQFSYTPTGTAGAADYIELTGVQLEKGSTATSFENRPYGTELQLCQRYYRQYIQGIGKWTTTTSFSIYVGFPTSMRVTPTGGTPSGNIDEIGLAIRAASAISAIVGNTDGAEIRITTAAATNGAVGGSSVCIIPLSAEL